VFSKNKFESDVARCCTDLTALLPAIAQRHSPLALLAALTEHIGGALRLLMQSGTCTPAQARAVLACCRRAALRIPESPSNAAPDT
jgi:hypothetical protein